MCPVSTSASFISRFVIPVLFIKFPANIKSGIASIVNDCVVDSAFCTTIVYGSPGVIKKNKSPEIPIENATGIPNKSKTKNAITTIPIPLIGQPSLLHSTRMRVLL